MVLTVDELLLFSAGLEGVVKKVKLYKVCCGLIGSLFLISLFYIPFTWPPGSLPWVKYLSTFHSTALYLVSTRPHFFIN